MDIDDRLTQLDWQTILADGWPTEPKYFKRPFGTPIYEPHWFFEVLSQFHDRINDKEKVPLLVHDSKGICRSGLINLKSAEFSPRF